MLTKNQFNVINYLINNTGKTTQRDISEQTGISIGSVNSSLKELNELSFLNGTAVTDNGLNIMENYRVKRAVIIAAGFGSRMVPITLNTPKPLVRVHGNRIIDSCLDALKNAGISEIYIVRGYLGEQFDQLLYKYPNLKFIENPIFNEANNISSIVYAGDLLKNTYIIEADLLLYNKNLITKYQYSTNYLGIPTTRTDDWCFYKKNGFISKMSIGGENCYKMVGISYWTEPDGQKLIKRAAELFNSPGGKERYWDQIPLEYYIKDFKIEIRECTADDIIEIDTFKELKELDKSYELS